MARQVPSLAQSGSITAWANQIYEYLSSGSLAEKEITAEAILLARVNSNARATVSGIMLYDAVNDVPVYSVGGAFVPLVNLETVETVSTAYNVDGVTFISGETEVLTGVLTAGTYRFSGFVTVTTDGTTTDAVAFYIADSTDLTTPVSSVISGSVILPNVADTTVQVPISGDLTTLGLSYSLVARASGSSLYNGKAHGLTGLDNLFASLTIRKVL